MAGSLADPALVGWRLGEEFPLLARWQVDSGAIGRGSRRGLPELTHSQVNCVIVQADFRENWMASRCHY